MTDTPEFTLSNLTRPGGPAPGAGKRRVGLTVTLVTGVIVLVAALAVVTTLLLTRASTSPTAVASAGATPTVNGIARPDASCVQTDGKNHQDMWNANGWWAGRIDGTEKQMSALAALSLKLNGREVDSAWICAPRSPG